jgi:putative spermidine/putrescine transport system permease protein
MSFSTAISFAFPLPGYWLGYYAKYFTSEEWLEPTLNSFVIAFGAMTLTCCSSCPRPSATCATGSAARRS